ncbi:MAG: AbrB/MazE/SpoVT family DNA-binding domain-containing protein [Sphingosinicella sp.]
MKLRIERWGKSLAIRLPEELVEKFGLKEGDRIDSDLLEAALIAARQPAGQS